MLGKCFTTRFTSRSGFLFSKLNLRCVGWQQISLMPLGLEFIILVTSFETFFWAPVLLVTFRT